MPLFTMFRKYFRNIIVTSRRSQVARQYSQLGAILERLEDRTLLSGLGAQFDADTVFKLHSNKDANHTIYLDFNGHTTTGTAWNEATVTFNKDTQDEYTHKIASSFTSDAFNTEGSSSSFTTNELISIHEIWAHVAEDYAPFDVNVTTELPAIADLEKSTVSGDKWGIRAVIGGNNKWYTDITGGNPRITGVNVSTSAEPRSFNSAIDTPTFIFSDHILSFNDIEA